MPGFELFGAAERQHVQDVLNTGILMRYGFDGLRNGIWKAKEFESAFAQRMGVDHCQLVSSGTAALTVALAAAGIGAGDEVIMPTFTFVASFESIIAIGAVPVLVDIDDTLCLDPTAVEAAITPKTKCVMPVHMCGAMADLEPLKAICDKHGLLLLEDACQAIGGTYQGTALGAYGDLGCFSFDFVKTITCGEGGGVITNNADYAKRADHYQDHGHDHIGNDRGAEAHPFLGYNYRISELQAAVGLGQLSQFDQILSIQRKNFSIIAEALADLPNVTPRRIPEGAEGNHSFINFFMESEAQAAKAQKALAEAGIDGCFYWYNNNWHYIRGWAHLKNATGAGPLSEAIKKELLSLETRDFSKSDQWMGRNLSCLVKLSWTEAEVRKRAAIMREVLSKL